MLRILPLEEKQKTDTEINLTLFTIGFRNLTVQLKIVYSNAIYIVILFGKGRTTKNTQSKSLQLYNRNSMQKFWQKLKQKQFSILMLMEIKKKSIKKIAD